jgi:hypothetical protein
VDILGERIEDETLILTVLQDLPSKGLIRTFRPSVHIEDIVLSFFATCPPLKAYVPA